MGTGKVNILKFQEYNITRLKDYFRAKLILQFCNLAILQFAFSANIFPQAEYVSADNPVYSFLNRMETLKLIEHYNPFEIPKSRGEIGKFLKEVIKQEDKLDEVDKEILNDLRIEFEYEIFGSLNSSERIIGEGSYNFFSQKEKYLFYYNDKDRANIFINLLADGELIYRNNSNLDINSSTSLGFYGGEIRGTVLNKFGFFLRGYQGQVFGNRETALLKKEIAYNYKYITETDEGYYDETSGYVTADFDLLKLKFGRDRLLIGYGETKSLVADNSPMFDYLSFNINYEFMNFSYFHGKLLGNSSFINDSITGGTNFVAEKYIGYHRLSFDFSQDISLGAGEIIIYGNRGIDLSYLNPFTFYKSVEHSNQDRDNSMLFFDLNLKPGYGLKLFSTFLIDDISFGKIGSGWFGNQTMLHAGIFSSSLYKITPIDLSLEYIRVEPYTFTHRLPGNNYTHNGYNVGIDLQPNSELFFSQINYRFNQRLRCSASFWYSIHGANPVLNNGDVENVGGNINLGHRVVDSENADFLDGDLEYSRKYSLLIFYEPFNQIYFSLHINYLNNSLQNFIRYKETQMFFIIGARI
ncbi:MAG TPA: capsule assembly Wzi family protein [Ignavibacteriaceae bacterium]|nr:capsule assembly Wzi family protein [Ignavibacteriaceae bacterium]